MQMNSARKIFSQDKAFYCLTLILWFSACICAVFFVFKSDGEIFSGANKYVADTLSHGVGVWSYVKLGCLQNIELMIFLLIASSAPVLLPITVALIIFKGFSLGFTSALLIKVYYFKGLGLCFGTVVLPYTFYIPILFKMFTLTLSFPLKKDTGYSSFRSESRRKDWAVHSISICLYTLILCIINFIGAFTTLFSIKIFM